MTANGVGQPDDLLTPAGVGLIADVSAKTVSRWAEQGLLPVAVVTPTGRRKFRRSDVEALLVAPCTS